MPIFDSETIAKAGLPLTPEMIKYGNSVNQFGQQVYCNPDKYALDYDATFSIFRHHNFIKTVERYLWEDLPPGLTADLIERVLFYRGKGVLYYNDKVEKFQFLPFALNKTIDEYGRYTGCNTLPFVGVDTDYDTEKTIKKKSKPANLIYENLDIIYDLPYNEEMLKIANENKTVGIILNDSSIGITQQPIIRNLSIRPILFLMARVMQIINTAMYGVADHNIIQVMNEGETASINSQISAINNDILKGRRFTPFQGNLTIQPLKTSGTADIEGLFNLFNSLDNLCDTVTGIPNSGVFNKKAHILQSESDISSSNADDIYYNGLRQRQEFCILVQAYYGYPTWCDSKRSLSENQQENYALGETDDPDNTQQSNEKGETQQ